MERRAALINRARRVTETTVMADRCQRLVYTENVNTDGRPIVATYTPGENYACVFSWGTDNDRTAESPGNITNSAPRMSLPLTATFTSRDRVRLTHREGEALTLPLTFHLAGQPLPGLLRMVLELSKVST